MQTPTNLNDHHVWDDEPRPHSDQLQMSEEIGRQITIVENTQASQQDLHFLQDSKDLEDEFNASDPVTILVA